MGQSVAKVARVFSNVVFENSWVINAGEAKVVKLPNITEIVVSIVDFKSVLQWECEVTVSLINTIYVALKCFYI